MATIVNRGKHFEPQDHHNPQDPLSGQTIGVLYGGPSAERDVSMESGKAVAQALIEAGHTVHRVIIDGTFDAKMARSLGIDVAFLALHGEFGEDGRLQMILDEAGIPYTGSDADASSVAFDKMLAKQAYEKNGILTPAWMCLERAEVDFNGPTALRDLAPPLVVKPSGCGSSLGVTIVRHPDQVPLALQEAFKYSESLVIERFIPGRELTVAVLGNEALPVAELQVAGEFYTYDAKYVDEATKIICPAELPRDAVNKAQASALNAHQALGCRDLSRTDMIMDSRGLFWVLETNTIPGLTSHSLLPRAAEAVGMGFAGMCELLLVRALEHASGKDRKAA